MKIPLIVRRNGFTTISVSVGRGRKRSCSVIVDISFDLTPYPLSLKERGF